MAWHKFRGLYGMVDLSPGDAEPTAPGQPVLPMLERARTLALALVRGGARIVQLRMKGASAADLMAAAAVVGPIAREAGRPFVVNDRVDVALACGADAVHVGQDDLPLAAVRALIARSGGKMLVGVSTHGLDQVRAAVAGGADYLGFGPVFATRSKDNPDPVVGVELLRQACALAAPVPVVAIGGIDLEGVGACAGAGATCVAVISFVNRAPDVEGAARAVSHAFAAGHLG